MCCSMPCGLFPLIFSMFPLFSTVSCSGIRSYWTASASERTREVVVSTAEGTAWCGSCCFAKISFCRSSRSDVSLRPMDFLVSCFSDCRVLFYFRIFVLFFYGAWEVMLEYQICRCWIGIIASLTSDLMTSSSFSNFVCYWGRGWPFRFCFF